MLFRWLAFQKTEALPGHAPTHLNPGQWLHPWSRCAIRPPRVDRALGALHAPCSLNCTSPGSTSTCPGNFLKICPWHWVHGRWLKSNTNWHLYYAFYRSESYRKRFLMPKNIGIDTNRDLVNICQFFNLWPPGPYQVAQKWHSMALRCILPFWELWETIPGAKKHRNRHQSWLSKHMQFSLIFGHRPPRGSKVAQNGT